MKKKKSKSALMDVDSAQNKQGEIKDQDDILTEQVVEGIEVYRKQPMATFLSSLSAGMEIGFSFLLVALCYTFFSDKVASSTVPYIAAFAYPFGFILVVVGKSVLFTEQTSLLALPVLGRKRSLGELLKLWGLVILGNFIGGYIISALLILIGPSLGIISMEAIAEIALHVSHPSIPVIFGSAVLAGWLMGLLSWSVTSIKNAVGQIIVVYMITLIIGMAGFHHSIVGNIEMFSGLVTTAEISVIDYLMFVAITLIGNAGGGVFFVAFLKYRTYIANSSS